MSGDLMRTVSIDALLMARDDYVSSIQRAQASVAQALEVFARFSEYPPRLCLRIGGDVVELDDTEREDRWQREVDRSVWRHLFELSGVGDIMSGKKRDELSKLLGRNQIWVHSEKDKVPELTRENIERTFEDLYANRAEMFFESVEEVYRALSWDHKTNAPCAFTEKMILGYGADCWPGSKTWNVRHDANRIFDLERVICRYAEIPQPDYTCGVRVHKDHPFGVWLEGNYGEHAAPFKFKGHRKGTLHIVVHDRTIIDRMNLVMADRYPGQLAPPKK